MFVPEGGVGGRAYGLWMMSKWCVIFWLWWTVVTPNGWGIKIVLLNLVRVGLAIAEDEWVLCCISVVGSSLNDYGLVIWMNKGQCCLLVMMDLSDQRTGSAWCRPVVIVDACQTRGQGVSGVVLWLLWTLVIPEDRKWVVSSSGYCGHLSDQRTVSEWCRLVVIVDTCQTRGQRVSGVVLWLLWTLVRPEDSEWVVFSSCYSGHLSYQRTASEWCHLLVILDTCHTRGQRMSGVVFWLLLTLVIPEDSKWVVLSCGYCGHLSYQRTVSEWCCLLVIVDTCHSRGQQAYFLMLCSGHGGLMSQ